jgi:hypothetical protein
MALFFQQVFTLLTTNPGNLVYHLLLTFSIAGALPASLLLWRSTGFPPASRMLLGLSALLLLRLALFFISALAWSDVIQSQLLAPFERAVNLFSLVLIIWLWAFPEPLRLADAATLLLGLLALVYFVLSLVWWNAQPPSVHYNGSWSDVLGSSLSMGILLLGGLVLWRRSPENWGLGLAMLVLMFIGDLGQLLAPVLDSDYPGALRLAQMAAYPILLTLPQRYAPLSSGGLPAADSSAVYPGADPQFFQANLALASETDIDKMLTGMARIVCQAMAADACLIAFPVEGHDQLNIRCGYSQTVKTEVSSHLVEGSLASTVCNALRRSRPLRLPASSTIGGLPGMADALGSDQIGPLMAIPLEIAKKNGPQEPPYGIILVSLTSNRLWTANEQSLLNRWVEAFTPLLHQTHQTNTLETELTHSIEELEALRLQVDLATHEKETLVAKNEALQAEASQEHARKPLSLTWPNWRPRSTPCARNRPPKTLLQRPRRPRSCD